MRVLVIEDSPTNMTLCAIVLESAGHTVLKAETADSGIAIARSEGPDLILMDMLLPDMDGEAATRILKADAQTRTIPVIALTALAMKGDKERFLAAGCDGYVEKPLRYKALLAELEMFSQRANPE
ncbi:MAG TPA: response regulator [Ramlibacter sp.]|uniref:response regulator n=1 Tax=Ramlibacter sp. TaxID=1917967 RepID=UPI002B99F425|nr:response regulator [Ramlibacter sp.]HVZ43652.1 response regulator [Ramlibacter sp.]